MESLSRRFASIGEGFFNLRKVQMANVKWIKIIVDIFDDEKIRLIETLPDSDTILIIWFKLITMAGKCNDNGIIYLTREIPYNEEMLSTIMRRPINTIRLALNEFRKLGMIDVKNDFIALLNWEKHQSLDKMEKIQSDTRLRVQKHREKQKELCNVTVTKRNATEEDKIRLEEDKNNITQSEEYRKMIDGFTQSYKTIYNKEFVWKNQTKEFKAIKDIIKLIIDNPEINNSLKEYFKYCKDNPNDKYYQFTPVKFFTNINNLPLNKKSNKIETAQEYQESIDGLLKLRREKGL